MGTVNKITLNKWFNISIFIVSLGLLLWVVNKLDIIKTTLSAFGRENVIWFKFWGFITSLMLFFNFRYLCQLFDINDRVLTGFIFFSCFSVLTTVNVLGLSLIERKIHNISAICFGVSAYFCLLYLFLKAYLGKRIQQSQFFSLIIIGIAEIFFILLWRMNAVSEIFLAGSTQIFIFINILISKEVEEEVIALEEENANA